MNRTLVVSSNVLSVGYDEGSNILEVEFTKGGVYQYLGVPESVYRSFMSAGSKGRYLNQSIKDRYTCRQVN